MVQIRKRRWVCVAIYPLTPAKPAWSPGACLRNRSDCDGFCICGGKETDERIRDAGDVPAAVEGFFRQQGRAL